MFIIKTYEDDTRLIGYEPGDKVLLKHFVNRENISGVTIATYPVGTEVTVLPDHSMHGPFNENACIRNEWVKFADGAVEKVPHYKLEPKPQAEIKPSPPQFFVLPWREGKHTRHTKIVAFDPQHAVEKLKYTLGRYANPRTPEEINQIEFLAPIPMSEYKETGKEIWGCLVGL